MTTPSPHESRTLGFERFVFFSDAVFAIAITLLVLDLRLPNGGAGPFELAPLIPRFIGFGLSFYVIGRYWIAHHALFAAPQRCDTLLLNTNLAFLAAIAFLPFPTSVVILERADAGPVVFYALSVAAVGVLMLAVTLVATRRSVRANVTNGARARMVLNAAGPPLVFLLAAAVALARAHTALWVLLLLIPIGWVSDEIGKWLEQAVDGRKPHAQPQ